MRRTTTPCNTKAAVTHTLDGFPHCLTSLPLPPRCHRHHHRNTGDYHRHTFYCLPFRTPTAANLKRARSALLPQYRATPHLPPPTYLTARTAAFLPPLHRTHYTTPSHAPPAFTTGRRAPKVLHRCPTISTAGCYAFRCRRRTSRTCAGDLSRLRILRLCALCAAVTAASASLLSGWAGLVQAVAAG